MKEEITRAHLLGLQMAKEVLGGFTADEVGDSPYIAIMKLIDQAQAAPDEEAPVEFDYPQFHEVAMGCGLEDRGITDRYEAMRYGFDEAVDQFAQIIEGIGPLHTSPAPSQPQASAAKSAPAGAAESEAWLQEWARDKFTFAGRYKGSVYGNTDWALARALHSAMLAAAPQPAPQQGDEVRRLRDWIACAERLPADKRDVMVYCADSDEHMVGSSMGDGLFLFATASYGEKVVCRPTHWRYIDESDKPDLAASTGQEVG